MSLITIGAGDVQEYHGAQVPAFARLYANKPFTTDDGIFIERGSPSRPAFFQQFGAELIGTKIRIATGDAYTTTDSDAPDATYTLCIYDAKGRKLSTVLSRLRIPPDQDPTTWKVLEDYSRGKHLKYPPTYLDANTQLRMFDDIKDGAAVASDVQMGVVKLDTTPEDLASPIAVGVNSPVLDGVYHLNGFATIEEATFALNDGKTTELLIKELTAVPVNVSIHDNVTLVVEGEGKLDIADGATLVIGNMRDPGSRQIFSGAGTVRFEKGAVERMNVCWWVGAAENVDITSAIDEMFISCIYNGGGRCYFPAGRWQSTGGHLLPTGTTIEGSGRYGGALSVTGNSLIQLIGDPMDDDPYFLFKIGHYISQTVFKDIRLDGQLALGTSIGILCEGQAVSPAEPNNAGDLRGDNCTINAFAHGFMVNSLPSEFSQWQMAQISFVGSTFSSNIIDAVYCNTVNTEFYFESCFFGALGGGWIFDMQNSGVFSAVACEFAGHAGYLPCVDGIGGEGMAEGVIRTSGAHAPINFVACQDEGLRYFIYNQAAHYYSNFQLTGNLIQSPIYCKEACLITSIGNNYRSFTFKDAPGSAAIISSFGDMVYYGDVCTLDAHIAMRTNASTNSASANVTIPVPVPPAVGFVDTMKGRKVRLSQESPKWEYYGHVIAVPDANTLTLSLPPPVTATGVTLEILPTLAKFDGNSFLSTQTSPNENEMSFRLPAKFLSPKLTDGHSMIPVLSAGYFTEAAGANNSKILLRLGRTTEDGTFDFYYDFTRDYPTGRLQIKGNQVFPYRGYDFNADIYAEGALRNAAVMVPDPGSGTITIYPMLGNHFYVTLGLVPAYSVVMFPLTDDGVDPPSVGEKTKCDGQIITVEFIQDAFGTRTAAFGTASGQFSFGTDVPAIVLSTAGSARDVAKFQYSKRLNKWLVIDFKKGFA